MCAVHHEAFISKQTNLSQLIVDDKKQTTSHLRIKGLLNGSIGVRNEGSLKLLKKQNASETTSLCALSSGRRVAPERVFEGDGNLQKHLIRE